MSTKRFAARFRPSFEMPKIANGMGSAVPERGSLLRRGHYEPWLHQGPARSPLEEHPSENVADAEEDEDHNRDDGGNEPHHRKQFRACLSIHPSNRRTARRGRLSATTRPPPGVN